jgi:GTP-binding protein EngB required for normal cell division
MSAKIERVMTKADKVQEKRLQADTAEIQKDAEADG